MIFNGTYHYNLYSVYFVNAMFQLQYDKVQLTGVTHRVSISDI